LLLGGGGVKMVGRGMMSRISEIECLIVEWQCRSFFVQVLHANPL
jgi:hypothetical protein